MKTAIVFSGGGSRGAYQVGVWRALNKLGIKADIVVGCSVGSITSALYIAGDIDRAYKIYENLSINNIFDREKLGIRLKPVNLLKTIKEEIDYEVLMKSKIEYGLITTKYPSLRSVSITKKDLTKDNYADYIVASCSIPFIFKASKIEKNRYIDGGVKNPIPVKLAEKMGAERIIIVNTSVLKPRYKVSNPNYYYIKPSEKIVSPIKFDKDESQYLMQLGYNDTMDVFKNVKWSK